MAGDIRGFAMVSREVAYHVTESVKVGLTLGWILLTLPSQNVT